jgi:hypothetical protein
VFEWGFRETGADTSSNGVTAVLNDPVVQNRPQFSDLEYGSDGKLKETVTANESRNSGYTHATKPSPQRSPGTKGANNNDDVFIDWNSSNKHSVQIGSSYNKTQGWYWSSDKELKLVIQNNKIYYGTHELRALTGTQLKWTSGTKVYYALLRNNNKYNDEHETGFQGYTTIESSIV